jgi:hypothetical protein
MKRLILLITLICIAEFSFSQTDFRNGYVITNDYDTLFGIVDYRENARAFKSCDIKVSKDQNTITYKPGSIVGYGFENDRFFQSREISIKNQPLQIAFLEVIVSGHLSLYKFEDTYFVEKDHDGLQQLINETKQVSVKGKDVLKKTNQHIRTITMLAFDCVEIRARLQKIKLREQDLTSLIEDYNRCKGRSSVTFKAKKPWAKAIIGLTAGLNISHLKFENTRGYEHLAGDFKVSKAPMIGVPIDILFPRLSERISFHCDLLYLTSNYYSFTVYDRTSPVERNYVTIELQQIKAPVGLRYTFPKREFTPYFNAGISGTIHLRSKSKWVEEVVVSNSVVNTHESEALALKNKQYGIWAGFGLVKSINNNLNGFFELRYERTNGVAPFEVDPAQLKSKISNFQMLIGVRIK